MRNNNENIARVLVDLFKIGTKQKDNASPYTLKSFCKQLLRAIEPPRVMDINPETMPNSNIL